MESNFEEFDHNEIALSDKDIFTKIWMSPREVFKYINDTRYAKFTTLLLILGGITSALNNATSRNMGDLLPLWGVLMACVIGGAVFGWLYFYVYAALMSWTGKWLKGVGNTRSLFRMMSYALIPSLVVLITFILRVVLFGNKEFQRNVDLFDNGFLTTSVYAVTAFIEIAIGVWTLVILVIGISILNLILPGLLLIAVLIPIGAIAFILGDFMK